MMTVNPVLPKFLAVVGGEDKDGVFVEAAGHEVVQETPEFLVHLGDFGVVEGLQEIKVVVDPEFPTALLQEELEAETAKERQEVIE